MTVELKTIEENVIEWVSKYMKDFSFRQYQLEYIVKTLSAIINDNIAVNVIEAPTGSGKSILVMVMAGVLDKYYNKKSYILCSDLYLWEQYAQAIKANNLYFGKIKGATNNYICEETGEDFSLAPCRLHNIPYAKLYNHDWCYKNGWQCAFYCEYIRERHKALEANVTLMTYQLYFPYMCDDDIKSGDEYNVFSPRDVVFCDECHNVPDLCQHYCTIVLDEHYDCNKFKTLLDFCKAEQYNLKDGTNFMDFDTSTYMSELQDVYHELQEVPAENPREVYALLKKYRDKIELLWQCYEIIDEVYKISNNKKPKRLKKREYTAIDISKYVDKLACSIKIYCKFAENAQEYVVKTDNKIPDPANYNNKKWPDKPVVCLKFAKEDVVVHRCILSNQPYTVMLSATVGGHQAFDNNIGTKLLGLNESNMFKIPSTFDFSKSPIYFIPGAKMSKDCITYNMCINAKIINNILKSHLHINEKGIIHTGSYKNAFDLYYMLDEEAKKRIYIYGSAKEKHQVLERFKRSKNGVLVGPTLTEGIDLPNDGCRFIVILKIPYPYLGDNLVKAKADLFPGWYNSETSNMVIQGIGRGNRTPDDWSTTYILDDCFSRLYNETRSQYPIEMQARVITLANDK